MRTALSARGNAAFYKPLIRYWEWFGGFLNRNPLDQTSRKQ